MAADSQPSGAASAALPGPSDELLARLEEIYLDLHANPKLSMQEHRTAGIVAAWLREIGFDVTEGVGGTGVVGAMLSAGDSREVTLFDRGAHGSMPQTSVDPVVMAASALMRLQTVASREVSMTDAAVVTIGALQVGSNDTSAVSAG